MFDEGPQAWYAATYGASMKPRVFADGQNCIMGF
jgi:hypothetical protein